MSKITNKNRITKPDSKSISKSKSGFLKILTSGITPYLLLIFIGTCVYFQTIGFALTGLDDTVIIGNIKTSLKTENLTSAFKYTAFMTDNGYFYRPMHLLSLMIDTKLTQSGFFVYHLSNLIIHLITCCLIFYMLSLFKTDKIKALILALIFLVHPLFLQAVAWIPARGDLLVTMFGLSSFIFWILYTKSKNIWYLIANIGTFFMAVFSKEIAILLPVIFLLYYLITYSDKKLKWKGIISIPNIVAGISWSIIIIIYFVLRMSAVKYTLPADEAGLQPLIHNLPAIPEFIAKFILPINLSTLPQFNIITTLTGLIIMLLAGIIAARYMKNSSKYMILFIAWFFIFTFTPLLYRHFLLDAAYDYLEHRTYLPMIGVLLLLSSINFKIKKINYVYFAGLVIFVLFAGLTLSRESIYKNPENFYKPEIDKDTHVALAYYNYGIGLKETGENDKALAYFNKAVELKDDYTDALIGRAMLNSLFGNSAQAIADFNKILKLGTSKDVTYFIRGKLNSEMGNPYLALADYNHAIELNSSKYEYFNNRANIYYKLNNFKQAIEDYKKTISLKPDFDYALNALGTIYGMLENHQEAYTWFQKAVTINPKNSEAWLNFGFAKLNTNDLRGACDCWSRAASTGNKRAKSILDKYCR